MFLRSLWDYQIMYVSPLNCHDGFYQNAKTPKRLEGLPWLASGILNKLIKQSKCFFRQFTYTEFLTYPLLCRKISYIFTICMWCCYLRAVIFWLSASFRILVGLFFAYSWSDSYFTTAKRAHTGCDYSDFSSISSSHMILFLACFPTTVI